MRIFFVAVALLCLQGCASSRSEQIEDYVPKYRSPARRELNRRMMSLNAIKYQIAYGSNPFWDDYDLHHETDNDGNHINHECGIQMREN